MKHGSATTTLKPLSQFLVIVAIEMTEAAELVGGVAIWSKFYLCSERVVLPDKPDEIEIVVVKLNCKLFVVGCYVPPHVVSRNSDNITRYIIDCIDSCLLDQPTFDVVLCGDFNRLKIETICRNCSLVNLHKQATYDKVELDYILFSESISLFYSVCKADPFDISSVSHASLLATPLCKSKSRWVLPRVVYDLRSSNVVNFVKHLSNLDWSFLKHNEYSVNEKCEIFHEMLNATLNATIPAKHVTFTSNTKPWITPLVKSLINERWNAYRQKNFSIYNHLKEKVKKEIEKSKAIWAQSHRLSQK
ncbi:MAG: endonuclease/exonuclease/phosphatase family protein, partial [Pseudomonadota bacterium]